MLVALEDPLKPLITNLFLFVIFIATGSAQQTSPPPDVQNAMDHFSKSALRANMRFLADDLLEGRGTGTRGQELAAKYVAAQFEAFGLEPGGGKGGWFQTVPFREITVDPSGCELSITRQGKTTRLKWGEDFLSRGNEFQPDISLEAPMVFVGFGVVNPGRQYDDYAGVDVKGKIVVSLPGAPSSFPANERAHFASGLEKRRQAAAHGAVGMIGLWTPDSEASLPWSRMPNQVESPAYRWLDSNGTPNDSFKEIRGAAVLSMASAENLFSGAPQSYAEVLKAGKEGKLHAFQFAGTVRLHAVSRHHEV